MSSNFFDVAAAEGSENEEVDENGEEIDRRDGEERFEDSSEEDDDDDDDVARREVAEGFIDDEDEDGEDGVRHRKLKRRKRRREERDEDEGLDEDDLDLIGERPEPAPKENKLKRLKRGHRVDEPTEAPGLRGMFDEADDDNDDGALREYASRNALVGEFDDFIEQDEDDEEQADEDEDIRVGPRKATALDALQGLGGDLDEAALEDMRAVFGDGDDYLWAIDAQEDEEIDKANEQGVELKDIFDPSQLKDMMLTDEDERVRTTDIPERLQVARGRFLTEELSEEEQTVRLNEESAWISALLWPKMRFSSSDLQEPFRKAVRQVLVYFNVNNLEVPFISQHRKDYLIHSVQVETTPDPSNPDKPTTVTQAEKLLQLTDLWEILELDLKYRGLLERRRTLQKLYDRVRESTGKSDAIIEDMLKTSINPEEVQDLQDYMNFQYAAEIRDNNARNTENGHKGVRAPTNLFERVKSSPAYSVVRGFGVDPDRLAQNILDESHSGFTDDPDDRPEDMADKFTDDKNFVTGSQVLKAAKAFFAEELANSPRMRKLLRQTYYMKGRIDCVRTARGLREILPVDPEYEFKYLRNQDLASMARRPDLFLRMLDAETRGLVEVRLRLEDNERMRRSYRRYIESDNVSDAAADWNALRCDALNEALDKLGRLMVKGVKENLKDECENKLARKCRSEFSARLDQAPYRPKGRRTGLAARVLALSNGAGREKGVSIVHWALMDPNEGLKDHGVYLDLRPANPDRAIPAGADVGHFVAVVERNQPDLIAVSGFSPDTTTLHKDLTAIIKEHNLTIQYDDSDDQPQTVLHEVQYVNDETARVYHLSDLGRQEHPALDPMTRYCIGLTRFVQDPLKEYAVLGNAIGDIKFDPHQDLVPKAKLLAHLETALVDIVNVTGVPVNDALVDHRTAALLPFVCGLGKRKAEAMVKTIRRMKGSKLKSRADLVGDPENNVPQAVSAQVFNNCASFLILPFDDVDLESNPLDSTRIHPEDYELAQKMACDAMDLDEEDIASEKQENGEWALVRQLFRDGLEDRVNDLLLELYAEQLERNFQQRKRATLETIRAELVDPYEEIRNEFLILEDPEVFTMLTGETTETLGDNMNVAAKIKKVFADHIACVLSCGVEATVSEADLPTGVGSTGQDPREVFKPYETIEARLLYLNRKQFGAQLSLREEALKRPTRNEMDREPGEWDDAQEAKDQLELQKRIEKTTGRAQRVIKHPFFRSFASKQAEEFLGSQPLGSLVIRPSSKGLDHLTVTWKVADNVYQHIDVIELEKENDYSMGRTLKIGAYSYSDLDELIANHIMAMAKKVQEIKADDRFNDGSKAVAENWLNSYMEANPRRSMYAFCINTKYPGYFHLCFKAHAKADIVTWPVKVIPNAFEMQKEKYPDMNSLRNGFKMLVARQPTANARR